MAQEQVDQKADTFRSKAKRALIKKRSRSVVVFLVVLMLWLGAVQYLAAEKYAASVGIVGESEAATTSVSPDGVDFGSLARGGSAVRFMTIENSGGGDVYVKVLKSGSIARFLSIRPDSFVLRPGETEKVEVLLEAASDAAEKEYQGKIMIFRFPKPF